MPGLLLPKFVKLVLLPFEPVALKLPADPVRLGPVDDDPCELADPLGLVDDSDGSTRTLLANSEASTKLRSFLLVVNKSTIGDSTKHQVNVPRENDSRG